MVQRVLYFCENYRKNDSATEPRRKFCIHYNLSDVNQAPTIQMVYNWERTFERTDHHSLNHDWPIQDVVRTGKHRACTRHKVLHSHPYKIQLVQALKPSDHAKSLQFAAEMLEMFPRFKNILFSDEPHLHLSDLNSQLNHQKSLHLMIVG